MLEHALKYLNEVKWSIMPIIRGKRKKPAVTWKELQTRLPTENEVKKWWSDFPDANIGVITGKQSGIMCVDFDGYKSIEVFRARICDLPDTLIQKSGREGFGRHYVFRFPEHYEVRNVQDLFGDGSGVDIRGEGGYFVIAPSVHLSGTVYEWLNRDPLEYGTDDILECPQELIDFLEARQAKSEVKKSADGVPELVKIATSFIPDGQKNDVLYKYACSLRGRGNIAKDEALILMRGAAANCETKVADKEVIARLEAAWKFEPNDPVLCGAEKKESEFIEKILPGVTGTKKDVERAAKTYAGYLFGNYKMSVTEVKHSLTTWNIFNSPKLSDADIDVIITDYQGKEGMHEFSRMIGEEIVNLERLEYPDGEVEYKIYVANIAKPATLTFDDLVSPLIFRKRLGVLINRIVRTPPAKKMHEWISTVNKFLEKAEIVIVPRDETELQVIVNIISKMIGAFRNQFWVGDNIDEADAIMKQCVVRENTIYLRIDSVIDQLAFAQSVQARNMSRSEVVKMLKQIGFSRMASGIWFPSAQKGGGKTVRVWKCTEIICDNQEGVSQPSLDAARTMEPDDYDVSFDVSEFV